MKRWFMVCGALLLVLWVAGGCARAAKDTTGFAVVNSDTVSAGFEDTWQTVKTILRERDLELYTRDKRGVFVAYTHMNRQLLLFPQRVEYTVKLEEMAPQSTRVTIVSQKQVYGSTPLTYPDWHDRPTKDNSEALAVLETLKTRLTG